MERKICYKRRREKKKPLCKLTLFFPHSLLSQVIQTWLPVCSLPALVCSSLMASCVWEKKNSLLTELCVCYFTFSRYGYQKDWCDVTEKTSLIFFSQNDREIRGTNIPVNCITFSSHRDWVTAWEKRWVLVKWYPVIIRHESWRG